MFTIRIKNRRIKLINWFIFLGVVFFMVYLVGSLIFMLSIFKKTYNYKLTKENYSIINKVTFKNAWFNCNTKEEYVIDADDEDIEKLIEKDLISDGFKKKKDKYVRNVKRFGFCKDERDNYKSTHSKNYVVFKLNGEKEQKVNYGNDFTDPYVTLKINGYDDKNVEISSNFNKNKVGSYVISYTAFISNDYKQRLYRKVNVVDEESPKLELMGDLMLELDYGSKYHEPGYVATDNYDGDITNEVDVKNTINTKKPGTYKITYKVKDSSNNIASQERTVTVKEKTDSVNKEEPDIEVKDGITYVDGILLVNKTYGLPKDYDPKVNKEALAALKELQADAEALGFELPLISGYRSYKTQEKLYNKYVKKDGEEQANTYSAKPGHSEHQTGLAFDVGSVDRSFANTDEAKWLEQNCHLYGFIIRYPKDKTSITGYIYEPWHIRYLGINTAKKVMESGLSLEEYLGVN